MATSLLFSNPPAGNPTWEHVTQWITTSRKDYLAQAKYKLQHDTLFAYLSWVEQIKTQCENSNLQKFERDIAIKSALQDTIFQWRDVLVKKLFHTKSFKFSEMELVQIFNLLQTDVKYGKLFATEEFKKQVRTLLNNKWEWLSKNTSLYSPQEAAQQVIHLKQCATSIAVQILQCKPYEVKQLEQSFADAQVKFETAAKDLIVQHVANAGENCVQEMSSLFDCCKAPVQQALVTYFKQHMGEKRELAQLFVGKYHHFAKELGL